MKIFNRAEAVQASTNTNTLVSDSVLNATNAMSVSFTIENSGANSIDWEVVAGNLADLSDATVVQAAATVASGAFSSYAVQIAPFEFYGIRIESTTTDQAGEGTIHGICKG